MSFIGNAIGSVLGGITGTKQAANAASDASQTQAASAQAGIDEQSREFDAIQKLLAPFVTAGTSALGVQGNIAGVNGADAQQSAYSAIQNSPAYQALSQQGQNAILQNASATGGLRGGNTQAALAKFQPALLAQLINDQFSQLGSITGTGLGAATQTGNAGQTSANNISQLLQQQGAATAGGQLAQGNVAANTFGTLAGLGGLFAGVGGVPGISKLF